VNALDQVFADPQVQARGMRLDLPHSSAASGSVPLVANPLKMSLTPPEYRHGPPTLGQHTDEVLEELLGLAEAERGELRAAGAIG
jgi:crotonobetainyl-CoA:carnitine CoA-transferase CaiB-like acyl-CoA transferase